PADAANALQSLVSRLRAVLGQEGAVEWRAGGYLLAVEPESVDARRFERLLREGEEALGSDPVAARELLREALSLWRGDPLAGLADGGGGQAEAARLRELRLGAVERLVETELARGEQAILLPELEALVAEQPLDERLRGLLMRVLYASGRQADALALYDRTRRLFREELGVEPSAQLQRLHLGVLRRDPGLEGPAAPAAGDEPAPSRPETNLRAPLTSFVGRQRDLERVESLVRDHRLVTLVGPGGSGKTRLALEVAARLAAAPAGLDAVRLVELAPLSDTVDLPQALLSALGLREAGLVDRRAPGAADPVERLVEALSPSRTLILLDNCEHLVEQVARLADTILARCPLVRVLATSREPLALAGEALHPVGPLELPPAAVDLEAADADEAVRLLCDRAAAARPGFALNDANLPAVVQVCRRLDGLPLAIELAAARLRSLSVQEVAARLDDRFGLLTGGSRTALPRHQTLRAVVDWSWDLLENPERVLLRRLSVFAGGATVEAAEQVCGVDGLHTTEVLNLLAVLVDRSLLEPAESDGGATRYRMLETVRAYAAERLREAGEEQRCRMRFSEFFAGLTGSADRELRGRDQLTWMARLDADLDNFRAALRSALDAGDAPLALRLANALSWYWSIRGLRGERHRWVSAALALSGEAEPAQRATALTVYALGLVERNRFEEALNAILSAGDLYERSGSRPSPSYLSLQPLLATFRGDHEAGRREAGRLLADPDIDEWTRASIVLSLAQLETFDGRMRDATRHYATAEQLFRGLGERWGLVQALQELADFAEQRGDYKEAERALTEAIAPAEELGAREDMAGLAIRLGVVRMLMGDEDGGGPWLERGLRLARELGSRETLIGAQASLGNLARQRGDLPEARRRFEEGLLLSPGGSDIPPFRAFLLGGLAKVAEEEGEEARCLALNQEALELITSTRLPFSVPWTRLLLVDSLLGFAGALALAGDPERGAVLLGAGDALRGDTPLSPLDRRDLDRTTARVRGALGPKRYEAARRRGAAMSYDEVVDYARRR
ncbi:MAG: AAA family ATPase, partial [Candidatus Dormibacteraeota bacterium]|nr:AAA family ATPase [Candidatus Dormibacteraeota bacterium]